MYTRVESRFWQDEKMRTVSDDARYLMLYLLTSPHRNIVGFYFLPSPYACFDLGWDEKRFMKALQELLSAGLIRYDKQVHVVLVKNYLKHNPLENPNQVKSAIEKIKEIPKTPLFQDFLEIVKQLDKPLYKPLIEHLHIRLPKQGTGSGSGSETGSGTGTETESKGTESAHAPTTKPEKIKYAEFVSLTNDEYSSLVAKLGEEGTRRCIEILDNYKGAKGKKYKSDYRAILNWVVERYEEEKRRKQQDKPKTNNPFLELAKEEGLL